MSYDLSSEKAREVLGVVSEISGRPAEDLAPENHLVGDLGIDSPKAFQLLLRLEEVFALEISDEDAVRMNTVSDILAYLKVEPKSA